MSTSPKRESEESEDSDLERAKKPRIAPDSPSEAEEVPLTIPTTAPADSQIDHNAAIAYWSATEPTVNGVLGGYPQVSRVDIQGSSNFLAKLKRQSTLLPQGKGKLKRVVDCGAGIGRVTTGFLCKVAETVDVVEPVKNFTDQIKVENLREVYNVGLEEWEPENHGLGPYDLIWNQWCVGQLSDAELVKYLKRLPPVLSGGGWIVVKENLSNHHLEEDVFDEVDSSVTRTDRKFRQLFKEAGLKIVGTELQKGMPKSLYPVRSYALQPG